MTDLTWAAIRTQTAERYGNLPRAEDESTIIDVFELMPTVVLQAIDEVETAWKAGQVTWPWAALAGRLTHGKEALRDVKVTTGTAITKRIARAEQWIHAAGIHFDRIDEVEDELFGERGHYRDLGNDPAVRQRLLALWQNERPEGERVEREADERAARYVAANPPGQPPRDRPEPQELPALPAALTESTTEIDIPF